MGFQNDAQVCIWNMLKTLRRRKIAKVDAYLYFFGDEEQFNPSPIQEGITYTCTEVRYTLLVLSAR